MSKAMITYKVVPLNKSVEITGIATAFDVIRPKGFYFSGEMHDFWEIVFLKSGKAIVTADDAVIELKPGEMLFHCPMEFHRISCTDECPANLVIISFTAKGNMMNFFKKKLFIPNEKQTELYFAAVNGFSEFLSGSETSDIKVTQSRLALEEMLCLLTSTAQSDAVCESESAVRYREIIHVLQSSCGENICLREIAERCRMSESLLKQTFHKYCDRGVMDYLTELKIKKATELLTQNISIKEISLRLGFDTVSYFHRVFKKKTGTTPARYRTENHK